MARLVSALALFLVFVCVAEGFMNQPDYVQLDEPCPPDEKCPHHPEAVCKVDCMQVDANGRGNDCVYHFYDAEGNFVPCWF